jgi:hypothetical protein
MLTFIIKIGFFQFRMFSLMDLGIRNALNAFMESEMISSGDY